MGCLLVIVAPISKTAFGQDARLEAKIVELEKRIKEIETAKPKGPALLPTVTAPPRQYVEGNEIVAGLGTPVAADAVEQPAPTSGTLGVIPALNAFKDGFIVTSNDAKHQLRVTGQIQADSRTYTRHGDFTDNDTFLVRRARLGIEATVFQNYEFRFLPDWGNNKSIIQDAYLNVHYWDQLQLQVGKFKEPVSYEQLIQDRFVPTLERSLIDQIVPARDVGIMIHGEKLFGNHFDFAAGAFNGEPNSDLDTNKIRDFAGRVAVRPLNFDSLPEFMRPLQFGISGSVGKEQEALNFNGSSTPGTLRTPGNIPWLAFNSAVRADGIRTRVTPEVSYIYNSFGFAAQYMRMDQEMRSAVPTANVVAGKIVSITNDPVQDIRFDAYYFLMTYLVTGETRTTYGQAIKPLRPFEPLHPCANPGAWELVARMSHMQVDPAVFRADSLHNLAKANRNSNAATEMTLGFNWYLNTYVRMQFNWEHAWFQQPLLLGSNTYFSQTDAILVRFQIIF